MRALSVRIFAWSWNWVNAATDDSKQHYRFDPHFFFFFFFFFFANELYLPPVAYPSCERVVLLRFFCSFDSELLLMHSMRLPKRLVMHGDDERDHMFLVRRHPRVGDSSRDG